MKLFVIRESYFINIVILILSLFIGVFSLLFGIGNLINPEVSEAYLFQNTLICIVLCSVGILFLLVALVSIKGILYKFKKSDT